MALTKGITPMISLMNKQFNNHSLPSALGPGASQHQPMCKADYFHLMWQQIQNEDNLVNQRLIWMVFSQSFLFSAFATIMNAPEKPKNIIFSHLQDGLVWLLPCIAIIAGGLVYLSILTSLANIKHLRQAYEAYPEDQSIQAFPPIQSTPIVRWFAAFPPTLLPLVFILTWLLIFVARLMLSNTSSG
jgi:hypothetical protein